MLPHSFHGLGKAPDSSPTRTRTLFAVLKFKHRNSFLFRFGEPRPRHTRSAEITDPKKGTLAMETNPLRGHVFLCAMAPAREIQAHVTLHSSSVFESTASTAHTYLKIWYSGYLICTGRSALVRITLSGTLSFHSLKPPRKITHMSCSDRFP